MPNTLSNLGNGVCDHICHEVECNKSRIVPVLSDIPDQDDIAPVKTAELQYPSAPKVVVGHADS